jgi:heparanase 1
MLRLVFCVGVTGACGAGVYPASFNIDLQTARLSIPEEFQSFCEDSYGLIHPGRWLEQRDTVFYDEFMQNLAKPFSPAYFRYGGTKADFAVYEFGGQSFGVKVTDPPEETVTYNASIFNGVVDFAASAGWKPVLGVNSFTARNDDNSWNPDGLRAMLAYAKSQDIKLAGWEFGNEPDLYNKHHEPKVPVELHADEYPQFRSELRSSGQEEALVIGPDVTRNNVSYMREFVQRAGESIDVATFHHYYGSGNPDAGSAYVGPEDFHDPKVMDLFLHTAQEMESATSAWRAAKPNRQLWVGETSSIYGGGSEYSASFLAGFLWLDKLGVAANVGISVVLRESWAHSAYAVVGYDNLPNPDYFSALLWRQLVGTRVLSVAGGLEDGRECRTYAFCSRRHAGGVVLVWLNTQAQSVELSHNVPGRQESYLLTSAPDQPTSREVYLNGNLLQVDSSTAEVVLQPRILNKESSVTMPPHSYGFLEMPNAGAGACHSEFVV